MTNSHVIQRTSPKGGEFIGKCSKCGKEGLRLGDLWGCPIGETIRGSDLMHAIAGGKGEVGWTRGPSE